jgi:hypothetical protein
MFAVMTFLVSFLGACNVTGGSQNSFGFHEFQFIINNEFHRRIDASVISGKTETVGITSIIE